MDEDIVVTVDGTEFSGTLTDAQSPETVAAVREKLPVEGRPQRWGGEFYFPVGIGVGVEDATAAVAVGTLAYWPEGDALCLFFGPTPASDGEEPVAASPVNVIGRVEDAAAIRELGHVSEIQIEHVH